MKRPAIALGLLLALLLAGCMEAPTPSGAVAETVTPTAVTPTATPEPTPIPTPEPTPMPPTVATLAVCGDAMAHDYISNDAWDPERGVYDYTHIFAAAGPYVEAADYAVVNLETPLAGGEPSGYPSFNADDAMAYNLKDLGFDLCQTANNHSLDKRYAGLTRTLDVLDAAGLAHVGTSRSPEEAANHVYVADVGGISVAFMAYTYGTNAIPIPSDHPESINVYNKDYMTTLADPDYDYLLEGLEAAKALEPDLIAVMIHWGNEYKIKQNSYQERVADFLFENGADIILGGHPHVLEPMGFRELTDEDGGTRQGFICYSLGNFFSAQTKEYTDTTVVLTLELTRDNETGKAQVTDYSYVPMYVHRTGSSPNRHFELMDAHAALEAGVEDADLKAKLQKAILDCHDILGPEHDPKAPTAE